MEIDRPTTITCKILGMEQSSYCYKACSKCETAMPESPSHSFCEKCNRSRSYKRLFRLIFSIATHNKVFDVVCFDRAARVIFGCSAQQFFDFDTLHPFAVKNASDALVGEMFQTTLTKAIKTNAEHLRMTAVVPLRSDFQPVIKTLKELYQEIYEAKSAWYSCVKK